MKDSNKKRDEFIPKYNKKQNLFDEDDYSESSLEKKIKKLQRKTFEQNENKEKEYYNYYPNKIEDSLKNSNMNSKKGKNISNSCSNKSLFNSNKKKSGFNYQNKFNKSKSSSKLFTTNKKNKSNTSVNKNKIIQNNSIRSNGTHKNSLCSEYNTNFNKTKENNDANIRKYQNEIIQLKNIINRLKIENEKLKKNLQEERKQNKKFKQLTEEIIKHYEKNKYTP